VRNYLKIQKLELRKASLVEPAVSYRALKGVEYDTDVVSGHLSSVGVCSILRRLFQRTRKQVRLKQWLLSQMHRSRIDTCVRSSMGEE
jgi:hypothetical protein